MSLPLEGVRILSCEQMLAGPYGTMLLAAFGADVLRVERPPDGELYRTNPPFVENANGRVSYGLLANNLNKRSIVLDLHQEEGKEIFRSLAREYDVVWENNRPGVMDRLGLGYADLRSINEKIVYVSISGFGQSWTSKTPFAEMPAFDIIAQALGGLMMRPGNEGDPPVYSGYALGDQLPSIMGALGCMIALHGRDRTGTGRHVDISMYDTMASLMSQTLSQYLFDPSIVRRGGVATSSPYGSYAARDGHFILAIVTPGAWKTLCELIGRADLLADAGLQSGRDRRIRQDEVRVAIEAWSALMNVAEVLEKLVGAGLPASKVQDIADLLACPHLRARDMILAVEDPVLGTTPVMGFPILMSQVQARRAPPPQLGQHTDEVLAQELRLTPSAIADLKKRKVVQ